MKRYEFQKSQENMASLSELLRHPLMRIAIEIVKTESVGLPDPIPGVSYESQVAACGAFTAGAFRAFDRLESLCNPVGVPPASVPRTTKYDDAAKARMKAQAIYSDKDIEDIVP